MQVYTASFISRRGLVGWLCLTLDFSWAMDYCRWSGNPPKTSALTSRLKHLLKNSSCLIKFISVSQQLIFRHQNPFPGIGLEMNNRSQCCKFCSILQCQYETSMMWPSQNFLLYNRNIIKMKVTEWINNLKKNMSTPPPFWGHIQHVQIITI